MNRDEKLLPRRIGKREQAWMQRYGSLVRGDDDGLHIRHFPTAVEAAAASCGRELPSPTEIDAVCGKRSGMMKAAAFAREMGVHPRTVRRQWQRGGLPGCREDGPKLLKVPTHLLRLAHSYGLRGIERMTKAGLI